MLRPICLSLAVLAPGPVLADRVLTGSLTYLERIALPEGAQVAIEVRATDGGVLVRDTFPAEGVPAAFSVLVPTVDFQTDLIVSAGLEHDGLLFRYAPTQVVPVGAEAVDFGMLRTFPFTQTGFGSALDCGFVVVEVGFTPEGGARMRWGGEAVDLVADLVASGARYGDQRNPASYVWSKGDTAMVSIGGVELSCSTLPAGRFPLAGRGNEPGWLVEIGPDFISYTGGYGAYGRDVMMSAPVALPDGWLYSGGEPPLAVLAQYGPAFDTMTGMPYPWRMTVMTGDTILTGGGGAPEALLIGEWRFEDLGGQGVPDGPTATLRIDGDMRVSGMGGCNRFMGALGLTGETVGFGPIASTQMACPDAAMGLEARVFDALDRTDRFGIDETGALILYALDQPIARLRR